MRQRLSPGDTIVWMVWETTAADGELPSDRGIAVAFEADPGVGPGIAEVKV
jgi:hypothetical protein